MTPVHAIALSAPRTHVRYAFVYVCTVCLLFPLCLLPRVSLSARVSVLACLLACLLNASSHLRHACVQSSHLRHAWRAARSRVDGVMTARVCARGARTPTKPLRLGVLLGIRR
ncbi:uncharacterized protein K452DRAFT_51849 [Aplosporella prunicola CBS 121167]|uniref:Uncharacterized protein n=1 Tax=Aplosporella prunicola CBS 121167 TaxID=1176127 RepID=A0A6A6B7S4_9PEZI|nr:uncharacterized protein K452DRAFT_51849 [Aplosporella prunicola CBS 121167]KAF2140130.1 hypothetical protein K452DRAFT_51849 [Aplosporella prunicola CBS 121167]